MRPDGEVCIFISKCVAMVGKRSLLSIEWMVFAWKQTRCSSSTGVIGMAVLRVIQHPERNWSLSKKPSK